MSGWAGVFYAYTITNALSGKAYVGITHNLRKRWRQHKLGALHPKHRKYPIQRAIAKHGVGKFMFEPIACARGWDAACDVERALIAQNRTRAPFGYNATNGGDGTPGLARSLSIETRAKITAGLLGNKQSAETRAKRAASLLGRKRPAEVIAKSAAGNRGKRLSAETRAKISAAARNCSPETRAKMSAAARNRAPETYMGRIVSAETRAKISAANRGRKRSAEAIAKTAAANRGKKRPPEVIAKVAAANRMRPPFSAEVRAKMSLARRDLSPEARANMAAAQRGKKHSAETRAKMSEAHRKRMLPPKLRARVSEAVRLQHVRRRASSPDARPPLPLFGEV